jgi:hypothetical protein
MSGAERPPVSPQQFEIVDPHNVPVSFIDWAIDGVCIDNVVSVSLGTVDRAIRGANGAPRVIVAARLRMSRDQAVRLHEWLSGILNPPSAPGAPEPPPVPRNQIN